MQEGYVLVTGINGVIGRYVALRLIDEGFRVLGVSIEPECFLNKKQIVYERADITDQKRIEGVFANYSVKALIHLAAIVHKKSSDLSWESYYRVNYQASEYIFQCAARHGVESILFASTVEVYGAPQNQIVTEDSELCPESDYGKTKKLAEESLLALQKNNNNIRCAIMRFAPVYAEDFRLNIDKRIYLRYPGLAYYFKQGDYSFHFCSVHNISDFVVGWLKGGKSGIFNISDSEPCSAKELIRLEKEAGRAKRVVRLPLAFCRLVIWLVEKLFKIIGKKENMLSLYNFNKLFRSVYWDNRAMQEITGVPRWNIRNTLYEQAENRGDLNGNAARIANSVGKRVFDLIVCGLALLLLSPIFLSIALVVKLTSKGPVFFRQRRVGIGKSHFLIYKYRTMYSDTPKDIPTHLLENPDRFITPAGRFLRKSSLDELPQLLNVLRGEMSLVGPRPALWNQYDLIAERDKYGANDVPPGITGWAQINGRDELEIPVKAALDGYYVQNWSFGFDLKILLRTIWKVFRRDGILEGSKSKAESRI